MIISTIFCYGCKESKQVGHNTSYYPSICSDCVKKHEEKQLRGYLDNLSKLSIEERLKLLETVIYYLNKQQTNFDINTLI